MEDLLYQIFSDIPRQGPGSRFSTLQAARLITDVPEEPVILDLGCGTGAQTLVVASHFGGKVYAVDNFKPYLQILELNAIKFGLNETIVCRPGDMFNLDFPENYFDIIWAEGSVYILGFANGLKSLKPHLKTGGYVAATEISWLREDIPDDLAAFWEIEYPDMKTLTSNLKTVAASGYQLVDYFALPPTAWWDEFYTPLEKRLVKLRQQFDDDDEALELIELTQLEIDLYRKYPDYYSYIFYILRKN